MNNFSNNENKAIKDLLSKSSTAFPSEHFTNMLMKKINTITVRDKIFSKFFNRSLILTFLSCILFIGVLFIIPDKDFSASIYKTQWLIFSNYIIYYASALASTILILYQINNIVSLRKPLTTNKLSAA